MPTIIDSLFLELGIDTSKFSAEQKKALELIQKFESKTKHAAKGAAKEVKSVGAAFRDIADSSRIGTSAQRLDTFALKLRNLGISAQVAGGVGAPLGAMATGLGALLSPAALGVAALGLLGKGVWDLNEKMTAANATTYRMAMLSGMNAKSMWSWGEAAKTVGGSPTAVAGGIAGVQSAIAGMGIGAGNATSQLTGLARLGVKWNFQHGVDIKSLFERVHQMGQTQGWARTWALVSSYGLMNQDEFNLAMSRKGGYAAYQYAQHAVPPNFNEVLKKSLESQALLGKKDIMEAALAERAYGGIQSPMQALVGLITNVLAVLNTLLGWTIQGTSWLIRLAEHLGVVPRAIANGAGAMEKWLLGRSPSALLGGVPVSGKLPDFNARQAMAMQVLMSRGLSRNDAAAVVGNLSQESSLNPTISSDNGAHIGLGQWDKARQAVFGKVFGYRMGAKNIPERRQFLDEVLFARMELATSQQAAMRKMAAAADLLGKTRAFQNYDERPGASDTSLGTRLLFAQEAWENGFAYAQMAAVYSRRHGVIDRSVSHSAQIHGGIHVHTPATDPKAHAAAIKKELSTGPLLNPTAQNTVALASRGMAG